MEQSYNTIAERVNTLLAGEVQFTALAQKIVDFAVKELRLNGVAIFRVSDNRKLVRAFTYAHRVRSLVDRFLPRRFKELTVPLSLTDNLVVRTIIEGRPQQSEFLHDFSKHVLPDAFVDRMQRVMGAQLYVSYPIHGIDGSVIGVMMFGNVEKTITQDLERLLVFFTRQIGAVFSSTLQFDRILQQYKEQKMSVPRKRMKEEPTIKFTLRITKRQQNYIRRHIHGSTRTKAKFIRDLLDALIEKG